MLRDRFGQPVYTETDLCGMLLRDPTHNLSDAVVRNPITFNDVLELNDIPKLKQYIETPEFITVEQWDNFNQDQWLMPDEYKTLDIAEWLLLRCKSDAELQRVGQELLLYQDRDLFDMLRYLKYFIDTMRKHKIVWGVGRGSSVASYVLFLIGVHKINSIYWDIPISEFLRD